MITISIVICKNTEGRTIFICSSIDVCNLLMKSVKRNHMMDSLDDNDKLENRSKWWQRWVWVCVVCSRSSSNFHDFPYWPFDILQRLSDQLKTAQWGLLSAPKDQFPEGTRNDVLVSGSVTNNTWVQASDITSICCHSSSAQWLFCLSSVSGCPNQQGCRCIETSFSLKWK